MPRGGRGSSEEGTQGRRAWPTLGEGKFFRGGCKPNNEDPPIGVKSIPGFLWIYWEDVVSPLHFAQTLHPKPERQGEKEAPESVERARSPPSHPPRTVQRLQVQRGTAAEQRKMGSERGFETLNPKTGQVVE